MNDRTRSRVAPDACQVERCRRVLGEVAALPLPRPDACLPAATTRRLAQLVADADAVLRGIAIVESTDDDSADFTMEHAP